MPCLWGPVSPPGACPELVWVGLWRWREGVSRYGLFEGIGGIRQGAPVCPRPGGVQAIAQLCRTDFSGGRLQQCRSRPGFHCAGQRRRQLLLKALDPATLDDKVGQLHRGPASFGVGPVQITDRNEPAPCRLVLVIGLLFESPLGRRLSCSSCAAFCSASTSSGVLRAIFLILSCRAGRGGC